MTARDLLYANETRSQVRDAYERVTSTRGLVAQRLYSSEELSQVPALAAAFSFGVGNHVDDAGIRPGDRVLDLGCGAGIDAILAARRAGGSGRVYALDFLPEMLRRTARAAADAGLDNVAPIEAEMECIPLTAGAVDRIISNGAVKPLAAQGARLR